jgi:hypothetical protein
MRSLLLSLLIVSASQVNAQKNDSLPQRRNTIKLNLVTSMIYSKSAAVSFERVLKNNRSWGAMLGYVQFPVIGSLGSSITSTGNPRNTGYVVGGEYRFYLGKENKFYAPHGVYIGPYANYFSFSNGHDLNYTNPTTGTVTNASLSTELKVLNIGVQLGYQFLINDRWTIDMVFIGPSVSNYALDTSVSGTIDESLLSSELVKALADRFPLVKDLVDNQSANVHGSSSSWGKGFRYQFNIGYHFGRKKAKG